jgi:hypothetical protein
MFINDHSDHSPQKRRPRSRRASLRGIPLEISHLDQLDRLLALARECGETINETGTLADSCLAQVDRLAAQEPSNQILRRAERREQALRKRIAVLTERVADLERQLGAEKE